MEYINRNKRVRVDSYESDFNSPEVKRLREDLLDDLDDSEFCTATHDFDSFMKSFEQEITASPGTAIEVVDLTADSDESQPALGYLLEASDDDLGLPPPTAADTELVRISNELSSELWDEGFPSYDSFELGVADLGEFNNSNYYGCEYVALDGLFDYSDLSFGSPEFLWRPDTLPPN